MLAPIDEQTGGGLLIFRALAGSQAQGLSSEDSDTDTKGVCIPSVSHLLGLEPFEQWESASNDHVVYSLAKFVRLALEGNPNIIETLYVAPEDRLHVEPYFGDALLDARDMFLSQQVGVRFANYAVHQLERIERHHRWIVDPPHAEPDGAEFGGELRAGRWRFRSTGDERAFKAAWKKWNHYVTWRQERNPKRAALEAAHGYDTKHASHLCRLLTMGLEVLETGEVLVRRADAEWLRGVRNGQLSYAELLAWARERIANLGEAQKRSPLPEYPNRTRADALVTGLHREYIFRVG